MISTLRSAWHLLDRGARGRWALVIALALAVSAVEATSALLVGAVLGLVGRPEAGLDLPLIGDVHDRFPGVPAGDAYGWAVLGVMLFFLLRGALLILQRYVENRVAQISGARLAARLQRGYLAMPYEFHLRRNSSELIRNTTESPSTIVAYVFRPVVGVISDGLMIAGVLLVLVLQTPVLAAVGLVVVGPLLLLLLRGLQPRNARYGLEGQRLSQQSLMAAQESLGGVREITLFGRQDYFLRRFVDTRFSLAIMKYRRATLVEVPRTLIEAVAMVAVMAYVAVSYFQGRVLADSFSALGIAAYAVLRIVPSLNLVLANVNGIQFGAAAVEELRSEIDDIEARAASLAGDDRVRLSTEIHLRDVHFRYAGTESDVLRGISLTIRHGESVGIVGPTGGGKSTLLDVILGLLPPTSGDVLVDGAPLSGREAAWQRSVGVVSQANFLLDDTLRRNIAFGVPDRDVDPEQLAEATRLAQLDDVIARAPEGLDLVVGERGVRLSGGQRQRVAIARALYRRPDVLVFDEGTSALDNETEAEVIRALDALRGERTIISVAHRLSTVRGCDRIVLLDAGAVLAEGTYDELLAGSDRFQQIAR